MKENVVVYKLDMARSSRVFWVEICYKVWGVNIVSGFPRIMFDSEVFLFG